jgi:hypothetical protein
MLLTPAPPPPHVGHAPVSHAHGRGGGRGTASGAYPNVVITSDMLNAHKTKLARKPTPAPAPAHQDVFSTTSTR